MCQEVITNDCDTDPLKETWVKFCHDPEEEEEVEREEEEEKEGTTAAGAPYQVSIWQDVLNCVTQCVNRR